MRIKLTLERVSDDNILPLNYQYMISAWVYKIFFHADPKFSQWLHNQGYSYEKKQFKMFTFSPIFVKKKKIIQDQMVVFSPQVFLELRFFLPEQVQHFVQGLFQNQELQIRNGIRFLVVRVESLNLPVGGPNPQFVFRCRKIFLLLLPTCRQQMRTMGSCYVTIF